MKKYLVYVVLTTILLSCNNKHDDTYMMCVKVFNEHKRIIRNCSDCDKLEKYYHETGNNNGWDDFETFLSIYLLSYNDMEGWNDINNDKREQLNILHNELKSKIDMKFKTLNCQSEVIRAYTSFYEDLSSAIIGCSDYKEYNALVESVTYCINEMTHNRSCDCSDYVSSFALCRLVNASNNIKQEEEIVITKIIQNYNNKIAPVVAGFKADEQRELLKAYKSMYDMGVISREDYERYKNQILGY